MNDIKNIQSFMSTIESTLGASDEAYDNEAELCIESSARLINSHDKLTQQVADLRATLEAIKQHQQAVTPSGFEFSATWQIANKALAETDKE